MSELFAVHPMPGTASASLDEERREVLESVMEVLGGDQPDPEALAACSYLLEHLCRGMARQGG